MRYSKVRAGVVALGLAGVMAGTLGSPAGAQQSGYKAAKFEEPDLKVDRLTAAVQMTRENQAPTRGFTSPTSMAVDPEDARTIVAATADLRNRTCHLLVSRDTGRTWKFSKEPPSPTTYPWCTNLSAGVPTVSLAWGRDGVLYYAMQAYGEGEGIREGRSSIMLAKTTNLGDSWTTTLVDNNRGKTGVAPNDSGVTGLTVDTSGPRDVVAVGFNQAYPDAPTDSPLRNPNVMVSTSVDGGATFGPLVNLNEFSNLSQTIAGKSYKLLLRSSFGAPFLTSHNGTIIAVAGSQTPFNDQPAPNPEAGEGLTPGSFYSYPFPQLVARSTDQGKTWTVSQLGVPIYAGTGSMTGLGWSPDVGEKGGFVAVYGATHGSSRSTGLVDIVFQRSTDDGRTWSEPLMIDDDNPNLNATGFYPQLSVAPNGRIDVVFQDNRDTTDFRFHLRHTYSTDGGDTWSPNMQVTDRPMDFNFGISFNSDLRYPPGVASANQYAVFGWADTRLASDLTQTQDVFGAVAQFSALPATSNTTAPVVAAIFGGLMAAGVVLLLVLRSRRTPGPRASKAAKPAAVPVKGTG